MRRTKSAPRQVRSANCALRQCAMELSFADRNHAFSASSGAVVVHGQERSIKHLRSRAQCRNSSMSWAAPHSPRAPGDPPHRSERPQGQTLVLRTRCQKHGGKKFDMHKRIPMLSLLSRRRERLVASGIELPHKETQTDPQQRDIEGHDQEGDRRCRFIQVFPHSEK